jgi:type I restriction enzyme S subunit
MEWKVVKCQDVIDIRDGTHDTPKYVSVGYPLITSKNLKNGLIDFSEVSYISAEDHIEINKRSKVDKGDILLAMIGTIGNPVIVDVDQEFSIKNVALFKFKNSPVDPRFFKYLLESSIVKKQLERETKGGTQKFVSLKVLRNLEIPLAPIASQRRIADILDKTDEIVRKRKEAIALTEQLQKSIFLDMFGDPVINPKGWEKVTLGNLLAEELQNGAYFEKNYYTNDLTGVEMIHMSDAFYGTVTRGNLKRVLVSDAEVKKYQLNSDDILIARRSLNYEGAAKPCLIEDCCNPLIFESSLIRVRVKKNIINPIYLFSYMMQPRAREKYIYPYVTRSTISGINQAGLKKITIVVPPIALQNRFKEICNQIKKNSLKLELHLQESENLFNSLLQKAFKGEL